MALSTAADPKFSVGGGAHPQFANPKNVKKKLYLFFEK